MTISLWIVSTGFLISIATSYFISRYRGRWAVLDRPNNRSLHDKPLPRLGGIGIVTGILISAMMTYQSMIGIELIVSFLPMLFGFAIIASISILDDIYQVPVLLRLTLHITAGLLMVYGGLSINSIAIARWSINLSESVGIVFSILFIVWMTNLYNFMDGMDGLAAGMGIIGFGTFAILGYSANAWLFAQMSAVIAAVCGGFLFLNFPPAKIFMGDLGSASLGFLAAILMLWASHHNIFPLWVGVVVFSPFIIDATWTLGCRVIKGQRFWQAHQEHFYQRLCHLGWGQRRIVLSEYALMIVCSLLAIILNMINESLIQFVGLVGLLLALLALGLLVNNHEACRHKAES
jgi:UDP-N-acetylmuramyl pentapeptide phosphotransferase/UDP-N-acetylglucosamine-1-phosphate transferase